MALMHFSYLSPTLGFHTNVKVIVPAYDAGKHKDAPFSEVYQADRKFPTLYLLHGGGGNAGDWTRFTNIERMADKRRLAVVMPEAGTSFYSDMAHGYPYFTFLSEELPAVMESRFPLSSKREDRFAAGLSMGGYGAIKWALRKPDFFAAAAGLSGVSFVADIMRSRGFPETSPEHENSLVNNIWGGLDRLEGSLDDTRTLAMMAAASDKTRLPALYCCIGREDYSYEQTRRFMEFADEIGLPFTYEEGSGGHDWDFWDEYIGRVLEWLPLRNPYSSKEAE